MDTLRIRAYNVRFGDALLITIPDRAPGGTVTRRHILIDVGNVLSGKAGGGKDHVFAPVLENILEELDGQPLDLYVMTHEHMDHVQGLFYAANRLGLELPVRCAWLTASASPTYYEEHPQAQEKRAALVETYRAISEYVLALNAAGADMPPAVETLLANNNILSAADDDPQAPPSNPFRTADCIKYLRSLATEKTTYVQRGMTNLDDSHPFQETRFEIWGPEEDTAAYYGRFRPMALAVAPARRRNAKPKLHFLKPPPGVDTSAFYKLVESRRSGFVENLLAIDKAANNSSIVFSLEWRGWRLLFPGDAEIRSWKTMNKHEQLKPVHFLKVSHHGSDNGTPAGALLDKILPADTPDGKRRAALISSHPGTYSGVPGEAALARLQQRGLEVRVVHEEVGDGEFLDIEFNG
ncbi:MAG: hypothetical protein R3293_12485 [Candidatus Promineifilaceae bacterium]|nr:hypothetical protein [Candidatus Promineifilaceae bacterium]